MAIIFVSDKTKATTKQKCTLINAMCQDMNLENMKTISGMGAVFKQGITQERITSILETIKGNCILATKVVQ